MPQIFTRDENGRIEIASYFLDGVVIELLLVGDRLSDQGQAYEAARNQTEPYIFPRHWMAEQGDEVAAALGVQYQGGEFSKSHVDESNLEIAVFQLVNAMMLFYGLVMGAYRISLVTENEEKPV